MNLLDKIGKGAAIGIGVLAGYMSQQVYADDTLIYAAQKAAQEGKTDLARGYMEMATQLAAQRAKKEAKQEQEKTREEAKKKEINKNEKNHVFKPAEWYYERGIINKDEYYHLKAIAATWPNINSFSLPQAKGAAEDYRSEQKKKD